MTASIIVFIGLDQIASDNFPSSIVTVVKTLKGFGTTPIRIVLMGELRHNADVRIAIAAEIDQHVKTTKATNCTSPSAIDVEAIDSAADPSSKGNISIDDRPDFVNRWLAARVGELAAGMIGTTSKESNGSQVSVEANHGSDSDGTGTAARYVLETNPSPFASTLGCVIVVDSKLHDLPVVGPGHCIAFSGDAISVRDAWRISQVARRTPAASLQKDLPDDVVLIGVVKRYNPTKGFGFITVNDQDVFVHQSQVAGEGFRGLNIGATVSLRVEMIDGKPEAKDVVQKTPYVATYESEIVVEGSHRNAGAPTSVRKERRAKTRVGEGGGETARKARSSRRSNSAGSNASGNRSHSATYQHPKGTLVFSEDTIPYSFRAHDGTLYYFPMPILIPENSTAAKSKSLRHTYSSRPIPARVVAGGFSQRSVRERGGSCEPKVSRRTFGMLTPQQQEYQRHMAMAATNDIPQMGDRELPPPPPVYMLSNKSYRNTPQSPVTHTLQPTAQAFIPAHVNTKRNSNPYVRQHSPYDLALMPPSLSTSPAIVARNQAPPPPLAKQVDDGKQSVSAQSEVPPSAPTASPPVGSYASALLKSAPQNGLKIKTAPSDEDSKITAGVIQIPRRQR